MVKVIGIDFGTTNARMAVVEGVDAVVIPGVEGNRSTPSVVAFTKNGQRLVGEPAKRQAITNPENTLYSFKRLIGRDYDEIITERKLLPFKLTRGSGGDVRINVPETGKEYAPQEIAAMVLQKLKADAEAYLGESVTQAVVTVPVYFNYLQRQAIREAGKLAYLEVLRIISGPAAAALAYGLDKKKDEIILVFDLGGGTFDVSILEVSDGVVEVKSTSGDTCLGGDDYDAAVVDWIIDEFRKDQGIDLSKDRQTLQRLKEAAEKAKIELSSLTEVEVNLPVITSDASGPKHLQMRLSRSHFEQMTSHLTDRLCDPVTQALKDADLQPNQIDRVVLVGGSTRMPIVEETVRKMIGKEPNKSVNPDEVVAMGAAIQAGVLGGDVKGVVLLDVTPLSLGVETMGGVMTPLIRRNATIPTRGSKTFSTATDGQTTMDIHILQGECERAADNLSLGDFRFEGIQPAPHSVPEIIVTFGIDANDTFYVIAKDNSTGKEQRITLFESGLGKKAYPQTFWSDPTLLPTVVALESREEDRPDTGEPGPTSASQTLPQRQDKELEWPKAKLHPDAMPSGRSGVEGKGLSSAAISPGVEQPESVATEPPGVVPALVVQIPPEQYRPPERRLRIEVNRSTIKLRYHNGDEQQVFEGPCRLDPKIFLELANSPEEYGRKLFAAIFHDTPSVAAETGSTTLEGYNTVLRDPGAPVSVELLLDRNYADLHPLRWEYLLPPDSPEPLAVRERAPLYRLYGDGLRAQPRRRRPGQLRVVIAIASPETLGRPENVYLEQLARLDLAQEQEVVYSQEGLGGLQACSLAQVRLLSRAVGPPVTLDALRLAVADGCEVLHLICHGRYIEGTYYLILEDEAGNHDFVDARLFKTRLADAFPRLLILSTCLSARSDTGSVLSSLAAELVLHKAPAVLAMQDLLPISTAQLFNQRFYQHLARSGRIEMALAATRKDLYKSGLTKSPERDWAIPLLLLRHEIEPLFDPDYERAARAPVPEPRIRPFTQLGSGGNPEARRVQAALRAEAPAFARHPAVHDALQTFMAGGAAVPAYGVEAPVPPGRETETPRAAQDREILSAVISQTVIINPQDLATFVKARTRLDLPLLLYRQVATALSAGKHLMLIGPPGTGKTTLAEAICAFAERHKMCAGAMLTTATADWSTFDTVGGYTPTAEGELRFRPGLVLRAMASGSWLVIDEINRADVDKAFGEIFTVLSGQQVELPYTVASQPVRILPPRSANLGGWLPQGALGPADVVRHPNWRLIGAMNMYDKSSLFALSFAFMRRFAFIEVDLPEPDTYRSLVGEWLSGAFPDDHHLGPNLRDRFAELLGDNSLMRRRALGPAIVQDMAQYICRRGAAEGEGEHELLGEALLLYVVPQLDGLDQEAIKAVYTYLRDFLAWHEAQSPAITRAVRHRIKLLYPHLPDDFWDDEAPQ